MRQRPFSIAGDLHQLWLLVRAPHRGPRCMGNLLCMGLTLDFLCCPLPLVFDMSNDGPTPFVHMHVFNGDLLLSFASVAVQCIKKQGVSADNLFAWFRLS